MEKKELRVKIEFGPEESAPLEALLAELLRMARDDPPQDDA